MPPATSAGSDILYRPNEGFTPLATIMSPHGLSISGGHARGTDEPAHVRVI